MFNPDFGWGFGHGLTALLHMIVTGFAWILFASITIGVLFLLIRFLLVATRAAQLYVAANEPVRTLPTQPATASEQVTTPESPTKPMATDATVPNTTKRATARPATPRKNPPKP